MQKSRLPVRKEKNKPRVVLDTNVIVSALLSPDGAPAQILSLVAPGIIHVCYNQTILSEYETVLSRAKFKPEISQKLRSLVLGPLKEIGLLIASHDPSDFPMIDESDRVFYDVAKAAGAFLITGNMKHYPDEPFIITPRDFINKLSLQ
jgi:putative PIN family toxin of toxin-antitoxin system